MTLVRQNMTNDNDACGAPAGDELTRGNMTDAKQYAIRDAIAGISNCISDPMWADHAEVSKFSLKKWHKALHDALAIAEAARSSGFRDCIDAIRGAIEFGKQDVNHAPTEHWLAEFWDIGRKLAAPSLPAGDGLTDRQQHTVDCVNAWLKDAGLPAYSVPIDGAQADYVLVPRVMTDAMEGAFADAEAEHGTAQAMWQAAIRAAMSREQSGGK